MRIWLGYCINYWASISNHESQSKNSSLKSRHGSNAYIRNPPGKPLVKKGGKMTTILTLALLAVMIIAIIPDSAPKPVKRSIHQQSDELSRRRFH